MTEEQPLPPPPQATSCIFCNPFVFRQVHAYNYFSLTIKVFNSMAAVCRKANTATSHTREQPAGTESIVGSVLVGFGKAVPALEVANEALEALVDTNNEWIVTRTGIQSRHVATKETNADLAEAAARDALGWTKGGFCERRFEADEIDLVVFATITPDTVCPSMAGLLRRRLGLEHAIAFDVNAACTGFVYGITIAESMMAASAPALVGAAGRNPIRRALVVGAERLTRLTNWADRNTCVLFGDGAGAAILEWDETRAGIMSSFIANQDDSTNALTSPATYDAPQPFDSSGITKETPCAMGAAEQSTDAELGVAELVAAGRPRQVLYMDGPKVFKFAAEAMTEAVNQVLSRANLSLDDIACIIPHQANERIIKYAAKKLHRPMDFFQLSIANTGNTSAASVPMALADAYACERIKRGDKVILVAFGGGFTSGAVLYEA